MSSGRLRFRQTWAGFLASALGLVSAGAAVAQDSAPQLDWSSLRMGTAEADAMDSSGTRRSLYLDVELQQAAQLLLGRARPIAGAIALVDARTGHVLAASEVGDQSAGSLLFEPIAPAASVFKLVTTLALYEQTSVTPATRVCTKGGIRSIGPEHLVPGAGLGVVCTPFGHALGTSRNAVYAQLASRYLEPAQLRDFAARLGFNQPLSADAPGQLGALAVPEGELPFARTAAGFENSRLSVLGGAQLALTIANRGLFRPLRFLTPREGALPAVDPAPPRVFSARSAERVAHSMEFTVHSGTAQAAFTDEQGHPYMGSIAVSGKTGTRQPHASAPTASWFVGFAPSDNPTVVVSVLLQNSDLWHQKGHQLARDMLRVYFSRRGARGVTSPLPDSPRQPLATASLD